MQVMCQGLDDSCWINRKKYMNAKNQTMGSLAENAASELKNEHSGVRSVVFAALALWLGLVSYLASQGAFVGSPGSPPLGLFAGAAIPLVVFFAAYFGWSAFQAFILNTDLRLVTALQGWRWAGLGFLTLYASGILPWLFAFPAGLGDMAIGFTAPWILLRLVRQPTFVSSRRYRMWNIFGIIDFIVALSTGVLCSGLFPGISRLVGNITTSPMTRLPLILIPAYMVPFFIMLHATALLQARRLTRSARI